LVDLGPWPLIEGDQRVEVTRLVVWHYRAGASMRQIAARLGRSYSFVNVLMRQAGEPRRRPGGAQRGGRRPAT
jgi:transposase